MLCNPGGCIKSSKLLRAIIFLFIVFSAVTAQQSRTELSKKATDLINNKWSDSSFAEAMVLMSDVKETQVSRRAAMELLHTNRLKLSNDEMMKLLDGVSLIMKDQYLEPDFTAQAIHTMGNVTLTLEELGVIDRNKTEREVHYLLAISLDKRQKVKIRTQAINILGILKIHSSLEPLKTLLSSELNVPEIARPACLSLVRIDTVAAFPALSNAIRLTTNPEVFGTAAFSLGRIKNKESMFILETNSQRFPELSSCGNALSNMESVITEVLKRSEKEYIQSAIRSTLYLWKEGQRERYKPLLLKILTNAPFAEKKLALDRLIEDSTRKDIDLEKSDLSEILPFIKDLPEFKIETEYINSRLKAGLILPSEHGEPMKVQVKEGGIK